MKTLVDRLRTPVTVYYHPDENSELVDAANKIEELEARNRLHVATLHFIIVNLLTDPQLDTVLPHTHKPIRFYAIDEYGATAEEAE